MISVQILAFFYVHSTYVCCIETIYLLYRHHTVSLWQTHSVSVWKCQMCGRAGGGGGSRATPTPLGSPIPPSHTQDCYPALQGEETWLEGLDVISSKFADGGIAEQRTAADCSRQDL